ncbi:MAG: caspase family protein [Deltaproteobacteria bacterium]
MGRHALVIGIDKYDEGRSLGGCVADAKRMEQVLRWHGDTDRRSNFHVKLVLGDDDHRDVTVAVLRKEISDFFDRVGVADEVVFYFAGHASDDSKVIELKGRDSPGLGLGISVFELMARVNMCRAPEVVLILDCCFSGGVGDDSFGNLQLRPGVTVLASSSSEQAATERFGRGDFTSMIVEGLEGGAADLMGRVTIPSLFSFVAQAFPDLDQTPVLKSYATQVVAIRNTPIRIAQEILCRITTHFPTEDHALPVNMDHDDGGILIPPEKRTPKQAAYYDLRAYRDLDLVSAVTTSGEDTKGLWMALKEGGTVHLTKLGRHYWRLVKRGIIAAPAS